MLIDMILSRKSVDVGSLPASATSRWILLNITLVVLPLGDRSK